MADEKTSGSTPNQSSKDTGVTATARKIASVVGDLKFTNPLTGNTTNITQKLFDLEKAARAKLEDLLKNSGYVTAADLPIEETEYGPVILTKNLLNALTYVLDRTFRGWWYVYNWSSIESSVTPGEKDKSKTGSNTITKNNLTGRYDYNYKTKAEVDAEKEKADKENTKSNPILSTAEKKRKLQELEKVRAGSSLIRGKTHNDMDELEYAKMCKAAPVRLLKKGGASFKEMRLAKMSNGDFKYLILFCHEDATNMSEPAAKLQTLLNTNFDDEKAVEKAREASKERAKDEDFATLIKIMKQEKAGKETGEGEFSNVPVNVDALLSVADAYPYVQFFILNAKSEFIDLDDFSEKYEAAEDSSSGASSTSGKKTKKEILDEFAANRSQKLNQFNQTRSIITAVLDTKEMVKDLQGNIVRTNSGKSMNDRIRETKSSDDFKLGVLYAGIKENNDSSDLNKKREEEYLDPSSVTFSKDDAATSAIVGTWTGTNLEYIFSDDGKCSTLDRRTNKSTETNYECSSDGIICFDDGSDKKYKKYELKDSDTKLVFKTNKDEESTTLEKKKVTSAAEVKNIEGSWEFVRSLLGKLTANNRNITFKDDGTGSIVIFSKLDSSKIDSSHDFKYSPSKKEENTIEIQVTGSGTEAYRPLQMHFETYTKKNGEKRLKLKSADDEIELEFKPKSTTTSESMSPHLTGKRRLVVVEPTEDEENRKKAVGNDRKIRQVIEEPTSEI